MNRLVIWIYLPLCVVVFSCKQNQKITEGKRVKCLSEVKSPKNLTVKLKENELDFNTLKGRLNVDANLDSIYHSFTVSTRIQKDSLIWLSISKFGVEAFRVLITKDTVKYMDRIGRRYFEGDFTYLSTLLNAPVDFELVQSLLIGNSVPFYTDESKIKSSLDHAKCQYVLGTIRKSKMKRVAEKGKELKASVQSLHLLVTSFKIARMQFFEFNPERSVEVLFSDFVPVVDSIKLFPTSISCYIRATKTLSLNLKYSKYRFNEPLTFSFNIPNSYELISDDE